MPLESARLSPAENRVSWNRDFVVRPAVNATLFWTPRILCLAFAVFLSLFAFDVFERGRSFWETGLALAIHLIPTAVLLVVLALAWRRDWIGALVFAAAAILYGAGNTKHPTWILIISGPLILIAVLFLANWLQRRAASGPTPPEAGGRAS